MPTEPLRFGPYELLRRLGAGGMAETYLAVRRGPGGFEQHVCVKRILPAFEQDAEFVRLFLDEARLSARLRHANIVQVLDFGVVDGSHFLALELVEGLDLRALLKALAREQASLPTDLVSYLAFEVGNALDYAHRAGQDGHVAGIVHRDVSPSNVLLSEAGEVKLGDFGIAKAMNTPGVTRSGVLKGKVPYMAPEYARTAQVDARGDLFALGVMLYECLAGRRPFDGTTDLDTLTRITQGRHVPLAEAAPTTPRGLVDAVERLLLPDPEARFPNAPSLLDALVDVAPPPTARRILGELVRRHGASVASHGPDSTSRSLVYGDTVLGTPRGTEILADREVRPSQPPEVRTAGPNEETRTRLPAATPPLPTPASTPTPASLPERDPVVPALGTATVVDPGLRARMAVDALPTYPLPLPDAEMPKATAGPTPTSDTATIPPTATTVRFAALVAGGALALLAVGGAAFLLVTRAATPPPSAAPPSASSPPSASAGAPAGPGASAHARGTSPAATPTSLPSAGAPHLAHVQPAHDAGPTGQPPPASAAPTTTDPSPADPTGASDVAHPSARDGPAPHANLDASADASLTIVVVPYGDVLVDGHRVGTSPITVNIPPGRHNVGTSSSTRRTTVELHARERRRVVLR